MRKVLVMLEVDDNLAIKQFMGTLNYVEQEFKMVEQSGIYMTDARLLDDDDKYDVAAIQRAEEIFKGN